MLRLQWQLLYDRGKLLRLSRAGHATLVHTGCAMWWRAPGVVRLIGALFALRAAGEGIRSERTRWQRFQKTSRAPEPPYQNSRESDGTRASPTPLPRVWRGLATARAAQPRAARAHTRLCNTATLRDTAGPHRCMSWIVRNIPDTGWPLDQHVSATRDQRAAHGRRPGRAQPYLRTICVQMSYEGISGAQPAPISHKPAGLLCR